MKIGVVAPVVFSLLLAGCGSDDLPSNDDILRSVQPLFSMCKALSVGDVQKTNGRPLQDGGYLVDFDFTLAISALPENKEIGAEYLLFMETVPEARRKYKESLDDLRATQEQMEREQREWDKIARATLVEEVKRVTGDENPRNGFLEISYDGFVFGLTLGHAPLGYPQEVIEELKRVNESFRVKRSAHMAGLNDKYGMRLKDLQAVHDASSKILYRVDVGDLAGITYQIQINNLLKECALSQPKAKGWFFMATQKVLQRVSSQDIESLMKDKEVKLSSELKMVKTEKGWMSLP